MIMRMVTLLMLTAQMKLNTIDASEEDEERGNMGGEGFANIITFVVLLGVLFLAFMLVLAVLSFTGQFEQDFLDAEV